MQTVMRLNLQAHMARLEVQWKVKSILTRCSQCLKLSQIFVTAMEQLGFWKMMMGFPQMKGTALSADAVEKSVLIQSHDEQY